MTTFVAWFGSLPPSLAQVLGVLVVVAVLALTWWGIRDTLY